MNNDKMKAMQGEAGKAFNPFNRVLFNKGKRLKDR